MNSQLYATDIEHIFEKIRDVQQQQQQQPPDTAVHINSTSSLPSVKGADFDLSSFKYMVASFNHKKERSKPESVLQRERIPVKQHNSLEEALAANDEGFQRWMKCSKTLKQRYLRYYVDHKYASIPNPHETKGEKAERKLAMKKEKELLLKNLEEGKYDVSGVLLYNWCERKIMKFF